MKLIKHIKELPTDLQNIIVDYNNQLYNYLNDFTTYTPYIENQTDLSFNKINKIDKKCIKISEKDDYCFIPDKRDNPLIIQNEITKERFFKYDKYDIKEIINDYYYYLNDIERKEMEKSLKKLKNCIFYVEQNDTERKFTEFINTIFIIKNKRKDKEELLKLYKKLLYTDFKYKCGVCNKIYIKKEINRIDCMCCIYSRFVCNNCLS